eukprot:gene13323-biopygen5019
MAAVRFGTCNSELRGISLRSWGSNSTCPWRDESLDRPRAQGRDEACQLYNPGQLGGFSKGLSGQSESSGGGSTKDDNHDRELKSVRRDFNKRDTDTPYRRLAIIVRAREAHPRGAPPRHAMQWRYLPPPLAQEGGAQETFL